MQSQASPIPSDPECYMMKSEYVDLFFVRHWIHWIGSLHPSPPICHFSYQSPGISISPVKITAFPTQGCHWMFLHQFPPALFVALPAHRRKVPLPYQNKKKGKKI